MDVRLVLEQRLQEFQVDGALGPRGGCGPRGEHEGREAVSAAGQVHGGAAAQQHLGGGVVAQPDALVERGLLRLKVIIDADMKSMLIPQICSNSTVLGVRS